MHERHLSCWQACDRRYFDGLACDTKSLCDLIERACDCSCRTTARRCAPTSNAMDVRPSGGRLGLRVPPGDRAWVIVLHNLTILRANGRFRPGQRWRCYGSGAGCIPRTRSWLQMVAAGRVLRDYNQARRGTELSRRRGCRPRAFESAYDYEDHCGGDHKNLTIDTVDNTRTIR